MKYTTAFMWRLSVLLLLQISVAAGVFAQTPRPKTATTSFATDPSAQEWVKCAPFTLDAPSAEFSKNVRQAVWLKLDVNKIAEVWTKKPRYLSFSIPQPNGAPNVELLLERSEVFPADFKINTPQGEVKTDLGVHYRGKMADKSGKRGASMAAISVFRDEITGVYADETLGNMNLGKYGNPQQGKPMTYVLYAEKSLTKDMPFVCDIPTKDDIKSPDFSGESRMTTPHHVVGVYVEIENDLYNNLGGTVSASVYYLASIFNVVAMLYEKEDVKIQVSSSIFIWTTNDPYPDTTMTVCGNTLWAFHNAMNGGFTGDLAHLLSGDTWNCGRAWVGAICDPEIGKRVGVSGSLETTFPFFPTYSWTIEVITHELGHNLGSQHTQWCGWPGGPIDNCVAPEATGPGIPVCGSTGAAPINGGTIMSYCHLAAPGINLNHGFGLLPGNAIRNHVAASNCLYSVHLDCQNATEIFAPSWGNLDDNTGAVNNVSSYSCNAAWNESGPEKVYRIVTTVPTVITATVNSIAGTDHDVFILDQCSESFTSCIAYGDVTATTNGVVPPGEYFIVVDGFNGSQGIYALYVNTNGYCFANGNTDYEWINRVIIGSTNVFTGNNRGYAAELDKLVAIKKGDDIPFELNPAFRDQAYNEHWKIYVDVNEDKDFDDPYENIVTAGPSTTPVNGTFQIPQGVGNNGIFTRLRVTMSDNAGNNAACGTVPFGEKEDYMALIDDYCISRGNNSFSWINSVNIGSFTHTSGKDPFGYKFSQSTNERVFVQTGQTYAVNLQQTYFNAAYTETWKIYADFNHDLDFEDANEVLLQTTQPMTTAFSGSIQIPADAPSGWTRLRIQMEEEGDGTMEPCDKFTFGEVQDYWIFVDPYCATTANNAQEWITNVSIGNINNTTGSNAPGTTLGYAYYNQPNYVLPLNTYIPVSLTPGYAGTNYNEAWTVFIDLNQNNVFDSNEAVWTNGTGAAGLGAPGVQTGTFALPSGTLPGYTRMRVQMRYNSTWVPCGLNLRGEIEDYLIYIDDHCAAYGSSTATGHIDEFSVGAGFANVSGNNGGYGNFINSGPSLNIGDSHIFVFSPSQPSAQNMAIYMDYNRDNDFDDNGELAYHAEGFAGTIVDYLPVPFNATAGPARLRVILSPDLITDACGIGINGEVEDYTANLSTQCIVPTQVWAAVTTATSATLGQAEQSGANRYQFRYRLAGNTAWITPAVAIPNIKALTGLTQGATYEFQARVRCTTVLYSAWSATQTFTMPVAGVPCGNSQPIGVDHISPNSVTLYYDWVNATTYNVRYRIVGAPTWVSSNLAAAKRALTTLQPNTDYEWQVRTKCGTVWQPFSAIAYFRTLPTLNLGESGDDRAETAIQADVLQIMAAPNPFHDWMDVAIRDASEGDAQLLVTDLAGRTVAMEMLNLTEGDNNITLATNDWMPGMYAVRLVQANAVKVVMVVKQ